MAVELEFASLWTETFSNSGTSSMGLADRNLDRAMIFPPRVR